MIRIKGKTAKVEDIRTFFRSLPLFQGLPDEQVALLASRARTKRFDAGQTIILPEQTVRAFYVLASGRAKLSTLLPDGKEQTIYLFSPGEPFCLCWAFSQERFPASVAALEASAVHVIAMESLEEAAREAPGLLFNIILLLSHRLKEAMERIQSLSTRNADQRLALFLIGLKMRPETDDGFRLPLTQRELAKLLGLTPEALSRSFRHLGDEGLLSQTGREVRILDWSGLKDLGGRE